MPLPHKLDTQSSCYHRPCLAQIKITIKLHRNQSTFCSHDFYEVRLLHINSAKNAQLPKKQKLLPKIRTPKTLHKNRSIFHFKSFQTARSQHTTIADIRKILTNISWVVDKNMEQRIVLARKSCPNTYNFCCVFILKKKN